jgi:hypothetical protein
VHEKLLEEEGVEVAYPTLTRILRELGLGRAERARCDRVPDEPGAEMQHDTTVYTIALGGKPTRLVASLLYLRYSKRRYLRFYRSFNRFRMKCFLHEALSFWGYSAKLCVIDNTNLARLRGTGKLAVIVPEMAQFLKQYGSEFLCHALGHPNRKAGEERSFWTVETNFLPGRAFESLEDLNRQALQWATERMEHRPVSKTGLIPAKAFEHEAPSLIRLAPCLPAPCLVHQRSCDQYGFAAFEGNFYWVPGKGREDLKILQYADHVKLYRARELLCEYRLPPDGVKNQCFSPEGLPRPAHQPKNRKQPTEEEEKRLRALGGEVGAYLDFALEPKGSERHRFLRELFGLSEQMTRALFEKTLQRARKYEITEIETIRRIALLELGGGTGMLPSAEVDQSYQERDAYVEGRLTDTPDFSAYDRILEDDNG